MGNTALATKADTVAKRPAPNKGKLHMQPHEVADVIRWHVQGLTQEQIAARFDPPKAQSTISRVIAHFGTDNTGEAKRILRGGAAHMALNIVKKGQPKDHVNALKGLGVLEEQQQQGLTVIVGGEATVNIGIVSADSSRLSPPVSQDLHRLSD